MKNFWDQYTGQVEKFAVNLPREEEVSDDWYIDSLYGNDANDGRSANSAIKTCEELSKRVSVGAEGGLIRVYSLNDLPAFDTDFLMTLVGKNTRLVFGRMKGETKMSENHRSPVHAGIRRRNGTKKNSG